MDPPTYQYARYWDWIKPWVENEVQQNRKYQKLQAYQNALGPSIDVLSLIEEVERCPEYQTYGPRPSTQPGDIIQYPESNEGAKPYIMWDITNAEVFDSRQDESGTVEVFVNIITCDISSSMPTSDGNIVLQDVYSNSNNSNQYQGGSTGTYPNRQGGASGSGTKAAHHIRTRTGYGRGGRRTQQYAEADPSVPEAPASQASQDQSNANSAAGGGAQSKSFPKSKLSQAVGASEVENDADSEDASSDGTHDTKADRNLQEVPPGVNK